MVRFAFVLFVVFIVACSAAPGERVRRHGYDYGHGGYGGGFGGYGGGGGHGIAGGHGQGYGGAQIPISQSFSKSSASASSVGGSVVG